MIFVKAVVLQHPVELLKVLNMTLECHLLLPASCRQRTNILRGHHGSTTLLNISD